MNQIQVLKKSAVPQTDAKTVAAIALVIALNAVFMLGNAGATTVYGTISTVCATYAKPMLYGVAALVGLLGVGRGIIQIQSEDSNGGRTILMAIIGAVLIGGMLTVASAIVPAPTGATAFCP